MTFEEWWNSDEAQYNCTEDGDGCAISHHAAFMAGAAVQDKVNSDYYKAVDDALVVGPQTVATGDAVGDLGKLISWSIAVALDPAVSREAQTLIDRGAAMQKEIERLKAIRFDVSGPSGLTNEFVANLQAKLSRYESGVEVSYRLCTRLGRTWIEAEVPTDLVGKRNVAVLMMKEEVCPPNQLI